jgi:hypothetical protein
LSWKGFDGGPDAWSRIDAFFDEISQRSRGAFAMGPRW